MRSLSLYLARMLIFLVAVAGLAAFLVQGLIPIFWSNPGLNALILGVLLIGIVINLRHVTKLGPDFAWLHASQAGASSLATPRLLAALAAHWNDRSARAPLPPQIQRGILDSVSLRLDESREISRYFIGLLIFLGLLGTFWGLSHTVGSVGKVIGSLSIGGADAGAAFDALKSGLEAPLAGMGTAFSSSLFGLAGSLVLGFLDLQAGQAQNAFYNDLEEWLAGQSRPLGTASSASLPQDQPVPAYIQALLEQTADSLDHLQHTITRSEEGRIATQSALLTLTEKLTTLSDQMRAEQSLLIKLGEAQTELRPILTRLVEDNARGNAALIDELRKELRLLTRTVAASSHNPEA